MSLRSGAVATSTVGHPRHSTPTQPPGHRRRRGHRRRADRRAAREALPPSPPTCSARPRRPTASAAFVVTLVLGLVAASVRFAGLGSPTDGGTPVFDEKHYVPQAWQMLRNGGVEDNPGFELVVHPPLGKQLIAIGEAAVRLRRRRLAVPPRAGERAVRRAHHPGRPPPHPLHAAGRGRGRAADLRRAVARPGPHGHARRLLRAVRGGRVRHARLRPRRRPRPHGPVVAEGRVGDSPLGPRMGVRWWRLATGVLLGLGHRGEVVGHLLGRWRSPCSR